MASRTVPTTATEPEESLEDDQSMVPMLSGASHRSTRMTMSWISTIGPITVSSSPSTAVRPADVAE